MSPAKIPDSKLKADLHRLADELERVPRARDINLYGEHTYETYQRRYGGIKEALEEAGLAAHSKVSCGPGSIGIEALIEDLRRLGDQLGRPPNSTDIEEQGAYSLPTYYNYFENLADALSQAGFPAAEGNTIPREQLVDALQDLAHELGRPPTTTEINERNEYHMMTYRDRFGSKEGALAAAGIGDGITDSD